MLKLPGAYHYLVSSFFFPPVRKERTSLVTPILRPQILEAKRERHEHIVVYQRALANESLQERLAQLPYEFRVYGAGQDAEIGNVVFREFSEQGFVDDLRTARGVIAGGGYSLMGEAVHLGVPMLAVPIERQYEQALNASYLQQMNYGMASADFSVEAIARFIERTDAYEESLKAYPRGDNKMLFVLLDELLDCVSAGLSAPESLTSPSMGSWQ